MNWLHVHTKIQYPCAQLEVSPFNIEIITFEFMWENVLEVPLPINNVHLVCTFNSGAPVELEIIDSESQWVENAYFRTQVVLDFSLDSGEKKIVQIR